MIHTFIIYYAILFIHKKMLSLFSVPITMTPSIAEIDGIIIIGVAFSESFEVELT